MVRCERGSLNRGPDEGYVREGNERLTAWARSRSRRSSGVRLYAEDVDEVELSTEEVEKDRATLGIEVSFVGVMLNRDTTGQHSLFLSLT